MQSLLEDIQIPASHAHWDLLPMQSSTDLESSHLGELLTDALARARHLQQQHSSPIVFLGSDAPELPLESIVGALSSSYNNDRAVLCPSPDGGYGLLSVPSTINENVVFRDIPWSTSLTAMAQLKVLTDHNVHVQIGRLMPDIDQPQDVAQLCQRLLTTPEQHFENCLYASPFGTIQTSSCPYTKRALIALGQLPPG